MKRKTLFVLCALLPAVGSSLGAYYIGRRQAKPVLTDYAMPVRVTAVPNVPTAPLNENFDYPGATLVSETKGSGATIRQQTTSDSVETVRAYYQERITGPQFRAIQERMAAMRARSMAQLQARRLQQGMPPLPPSMTLTPPPSGNFSSSWGSGSTHVSTTASSTSGTSRISSSNNEREITVTMDSTSGQTRIRTVLIRK